MLNERRLLLELSSRPTMRGEQFLKGDHVGRTIELLTIIADDRCGLVNSATDKLERCILRRLHILGDPRTDAEDWGLQLYNFTESEIEDVLIEDITREHGGYIRWHGRCGMRRVTVRNCGSQGLQFAKRARHHGALECIDPAQYAVPGDFRIDEVTLENNGTLKGKRVGFALSCFKCQGEEPEGVPDCGGGFDFGRLRITHNGVKYPSGDPRAIVAQGGGRKGLTHWTCEELELAFPNTAANELCEFQCLPRLHVASASVQGPPVKVYARASDVVFWGGGEGDAELWIYACDASGKPIKGKLQKLLARDVYSKPAGVEL